MRVSIVGIIMASLFTVVVITAAFIGVGILLGPDGHPVFLMVTVFVAGIVGWTVGAKLFRVFRD